MSSTITAPRQRMRNVVVAAVSAVVVLAFALFVASPTKTALAATVQGVSKAPQGQEVVYGKVLDAKGKGVDHARVTILTKVKKGGKTTWKPARTVYTTKAGSYRTAFTSKTAVTLGVQFSVGTRKVVSSSVVSISARPSHAYSVGAKLLTTNRFAFFPVASY